MPPLDPVTPGQQPPGHELERSASDVGQGLARSLGAVLEGLPGSPTGPQNLARQLGIDKVLASRILKALRSRDPLAVLYHLPGPDPLRRFARAARRHGGSGSDEAENWIQSFEELIRREAGDRSSLDAILSAWLPEAREEFELRRKQAAFRAMSQLRGASTETDFSAVILHPSADGETIDVVWIMCTFGLQRLRPGVRVKYTTRRMTDAAGPRRPTNLDGEEVEGIDKVRLDQFCHAPPGPLEAHRTGEVTHYVLGDSGFGPRSTVDIVFAEVNLAELPRVPLAGRKQYFFAEIGTPAKRLVYDVFVHADLYEGKNPELHVYDTTGDGVADVNDPARDIDRLDVAETIQYLGTGLRNVRTAEIASYTDLANHVFTKMGWGPEDFRLYRCKIDYPIYGAQVCMAF